MKRITRRDFVKHATLSSAAVTVLPALSARSAENVPGANDRVRVAIVGAGSKGKQHTDIFHRLKNVDVVNVCDADRKRAESRARMISSDSHTVPHSVDIRTILDDNSIDAIVTATPNHWHVLVTLWGLQAGKHVYVEKPVSHNVFEGRVMAAAAKKYGKIVQAGFQSRSDTGLRKFFPWLHEGNLGEIEMLYGQCFRRRDGIGDRRKVPMDPTATNPDVDYNLWLGPAEDVPIHRKNLHYDWHWVWNTGNGDIGNQGPHELDLIQWARGDGALPTRVMGYGNRFGWNDAGETPNMHLARFDYGDYPCYFEVRDLAVKPGMKAGPANHGLRVGLYLKAEKGTFKGGRGGGKAYDNDGKLIQQFKGDGGGQHQQNFIDAVRADDPSKSHARIEDAVKSCDLAHLANIALRVGGHASGKELGEHLTGDAKAQETLGLFEKQLADWNINTLEEKYMFGDWLTYDAKEERFTGNGDLKVANAMLTRNYRDGFAVKENA